MPTIAIDADGTIFEWGHEGHLLGGWIEDAEGSLRELLADDSAGHPVEILVHSCRATWELGGGWQALADGLAAVGFRVYLDLGRDGDERVVQMVKGEADGEGPAVGIWMGRGKPIASAYVDDRAVPLIPELGGWKTAMPRVRELAGLGSRV
jgi:hypothetical protein